MRLVSALVVAGISFMGVSSPTFAFFEAFSTLSQELKAIEQSSPEGLGDLLEQLDATSTTKFGDVRSTDWFYRYVFSVARWGIVSGYKDAAGKPTGVFGPGNTVTVAEIVKMAMESAQVDETQCRGTPWAAQAEKHWAKAYVLCAQERNVRLIRSAPDLNRPARRAEVLSVIFDAFGDEPPPLFSPFKDTIDHPLESDIAYGAALKMVSGDKDASGNPLGTFRPDDPVVRAEAAKIIYERLRVEVMGEE
ncbi:hypothetical protein A2881_04395 [Candidatus Peribacteria bacterium RIFCSPHIGHO2_01_FULL_55_13]|nr:MAG: hypothetical protein A2881_04395 [Candidatus Peribacteria bacterium RIFCSPHIGHO2_01_FULL_55_13]OGJ65056.1 MAG: hypothetical protein A3F36_01260 [Candidatus Peribacteria bacterium RIFCSPHIGHO2_12_FULL_55_11]